VADELGASILVEWVDSPGIEKASLSGNIIAWQAQSDRAVNAALAAINLMAERLTRAVDEMEDSLCPNEIEVEFGIKLDAQTGALLAKAGAEAQMRVKYKWVTKEPSVVAPAPGQG
jgi:hypothetical protein